jgi:hypothetical protein
MNEGLRNYGRSVKGWIDFREQRLDGFISCEERPGWMKVSIEERLGLIYYSQEGTVIKMTLPTPW